MGYSIDADVQSIVGATDTTYPDRLCLVTGNQLRKHGKKQVKLLKVHPYKHFKNSVDPIEKLEFSVPAFSLLDFMKVDERKIEYKSKGKAPEKGAKKKTYWQAYTAEFSETFYDLNYLSNPSVPISEFRQILTLPAARCWIN